MPYVPIASLPPFLNDSNGRPLQAGTLYAYLAGTSTPTPMYADSAGTVLGTSVALDSRGEPDTVKMIWLDTAITYKFVLHNSGGVQQWSVDNIQPFLTGDAFAEGGTTVSDWSGGKYSATYVSASVFRVTGTHTNALTSEAEFHTGRRVLTFQPTGGTKAGTITDVATGANTDVTVSLDDGASLVNEALTVYLGAAKSAKGSGVPFYYPKSGETGVTNYTYPWGDVRRYGVPTDGTDGSTELQAAVTNVSVAEILIPYGVTVYARNISVPSNRTIRVDGTVALPAASADGSVIFQNSDQVGGNTKIRIVGEGKLDGNKANQSGASTKHHLVDIENCTYFEFAVREVEGNYFPIAIASSETTACVYVRNSNHAYVHDSTGRNYGRECFWVQTSNYCRVERLKTFGGVDSWSGLQFSGDYNHAEDIESHDAGASGISFDCRYSTANNLRSFDNAFSHGVNFGHSGIPADYSTVKNIISDGAASSGIQTAANTTGLIIDGFTITNPGSAAVKCSDGSDKITLRNGVAEHDGANGIYLSAYASDKTFYIDNVKTRAPTSGNGLVLDADTGIVLTVYGQESDFSASATGRAYVGAGSKVPLFSNVRVTSDAMYGAASIAGGTAGTGTTVTNGNVFATPLSVLIESGNAAANAAQPFVKTFNDGSFVIDYASAPAAGASVRWRIK